MAATGTPTPNLGLRRAQGTDPASVDDINYNSELLDTKLGAVGATSVQGQIDALSASTAQTFGNVQDGLAIVSNGNTHVAIPAGYWVYVKGHGTLSEGLYKNTSGATIAANATLSTSNLTADPDGGLNSVYAALNNKLINTAGTIVPNTTYVENDSIICVRNGNIVIVSGIFKAKTDIPALTELFEVSFTSNNRYNISLDTVDNKNFFAYLNGTKITTQTATIPSGTWCYLNFTYLKSGS